MSRTRSLDLALYTDAASNVDKHYSQLMAEQAANPVATDASKPTVALVVGPSPFTMPRGWEFFLASPYEGITYIATVLHNAGYPVRIIDVRYDPTPVETALREMKHDCDVLGLATYEDCYPFLEALIARSKEERPELPIILGGSLVTSVPHVFMNETRADVAVISEGELTILELMEAFTDGLWKQRLGKIKGIWYRSADGQVHQNGPRGQMVDLDSLPNMRLDLWPQAKSPMGLQPQIISSHSRGCKMDCSFCYRTTPQLREKSPAKLRAELKFLKETYNIKFIFFVDLTFTSNKRRTLEICEVIKEFDLSWTCLTRCADVDPEVLAAMKAAGCDIILYGVESLTPGVLKDARKGSTETLADRAMRMTIDAGIRFGGLMIVGLPGESQESLEHMAKWSETHRSITRVKYLSAMPGTTVYQQGIGTNLIRSEVDHLRWLAIEQALERDEFLNYNGLPDTVLRETYKRIYDSYCPGPVMDFQHYPEHFSYFDPNPDQGWRQAFSSAGAPPAPGTENFYREPDRIFNGV